MSHQQSGNDLNNNLTNDSNRVLSDDQVGSPVMSNHFDTAGQPRMVDVSDKLITRRVAIAEAWIMVSSVSMELIRRGSTKKGDVLAVARLAAITATKQTSTLIPLCHAIPIEGVDVDFEAEHEDRVRCVVTVRTTARTGVEMEAMTAASVAMLTIYDMCKSVDRSMELGPIRLLRKTGGKSGDFVSGAKASISTDD